MYVDISEYLTFPTRKISKWEKFEFANVKIHSDDTEQILFSCHQSSFRTKSEISSQLLFLIVFCSYKAQI